MRPGRQRQLACRGRHSLCSAALHSCQICLHAVPLYRFFLSLVRPLNLLPPGAWQHMRERWVARGRVGRCAAAVCCGHFGDSATSGGGGAGKAGYSGKEVATAGAAAEDDPAGKPRDGEAVLP